VDYRPTGLSPTAAGPDSTQLDAALARPRAKHPTATTPVLCRHRGLRFGATQYTD